MPFNRQICVSSFYYSPSPLFSVSKTEEVGGSPCSPKKNRGKLFEQKKLTRQRKIRHVSDQDLGLLELTHLPPAPDEPLHSPLSVLPQPLPLPESTSNRRLSQEYSCANLGEDRPRSPVKGPNSAFQRRDQIVTRPANTSGCSGPRVPNVQRNNRELKLRIPARSAPPSGFSSPAISPRRSSSGDIFLHNMSSDLSESTNRDRRTLSHDLNPEGVSCNQNCNSSPRSAPASGFSSPVLSPKELSKRETLTSCVSPKESRVPSRLEVPDLGRVVSHALQNSPQRSLQSNNHCSHCSATFQSPHHRPRFCNKSSVPMHSRLTEGSCKERPESSKNASAYPLPLPPGAAMSPPVMPSPSANIHPAVEKPNLPFRKPQWTKGKLIGRGTYGSVFVGTNRETGALCAMKEVSLIPDDPKSAECVKQLEQEIRILRQLKHPNIVQYYGSEIVDDHFYIYMEYVYPGSINRYVQEHRQDITESMVRNFTRHILSGLAYLHSTKTVHRDIKGANLLVDASGVVKLADFGMAKFLSGMSYELSLKGSPHWMAPEVIKAVIQKDLSSDLALAVDIWSLGCTVIEMFTGKAPWSDLQGPQVMFKILNKIPPIPDTLSPEGKDFLRVCFQRNPADRPSAAVLLEHPFLQNSCDFDLSACRHNLSAANSKDNFYCSRDYTCNNIDSRAEAKLPW
ncbi:hypothetical protein K2173_007441 [Erythroxylum novogranatense]|uniref:mitogen-activated protein kinase kinase kinase n=1 Tax=Erythroxylum novogranatense TaxID=1862640 RepID=A0AAV8T882_9ROSI|nr:hypothetical protein K2173_007441 [Erythroxylum novogranatense]